MLDEKGGHADQTKPSSRETLDSENTVSESMTLLLPVCKNNKKKTCFYKRTNSLIVVDWFDKWAKRHELLDNRLSLWLWI